MYYEILKVLLKNTIVFTISFGVYFIIRAFISAANGNPVDLITVILVFLISTVVSFINMEGKR